MQRMRPDHVFFNVQALLLTREAVSLLMFPPSGTLARRRSKSSGLVLGFLLRCQVGIAVAFKP